MGEERPYEELDLDELEREFNESWVDPEPEEVEESEDSETEEVETETETEEIEEAEESETEDSETEEEEEPEEETELNRDEPFKQKQKQTKEENAAFAQLRREKEQLEQQTKVLEQVAAQYGMTVDQFQQAYQQQQEEARAKEQGVPVDVLRRMEAMERQLNEQKNSSHKEKFWSEVDTVKSKYGLNNDEINKIFDYIGKNGLVNMDTGTPAVPFEFIYKAANHDNILERKVTEEKQKSLAAKKKRQATAAKGHTNSTAGKQTSPEDLSVDDVEKMLRSEGLL